MRKRPGTARISKKNLCPLSDPSLGIISENDHKVGLCLCRFCDCGEHQCPNLKGPEVKAKSSFKSSYMVSYQKASFDSPLKPEPKLFKANTNKLEFLTTNKADYKPFSITPEKPKALVYDKNIAKFLGKSQYAKDFPNWGGNLINYEKRWYPPLRTTEIGFNGKSTYSDCYSECSKSLNHIKPDFFTASKSTLSFGPKEKLDGTTSYNKFMQNHSGSNLNSKVVVAAETKAGLKISRDHYKTTNKSNEKIPESTVDPRLFKQVLIARSKSSRQHKRT